MASLAFESNHTEYPTFYLLVHPAPGAAGAA
jgi:hypothetical protein